MGGGRGGICFALVDADPLVDVIIRPGRCPVALGWAGLLNNCQTNYLTGD